MIFMRWIILNKGNIYSNQYIFLKYLFINVYFQKFIIINLFSPNLETLYTYNKNNIILIAQFL